MEQPHPMAIKTIRRMIGYMRNGRSWVDFSWPPQLAAFKSGGLGRCPRTQLMMLRLSNMTAKWLAEQSVASLSLTRVPSMVLMAVAQGAAAAAARHVCSRRHSLRLRDWPDDEDECEAAAAVLNAICGGCFHSMDIHLCEGPAAVARRGRLQLEKRLMRHAASRAWCENPDVVELRGLQALGLQAFAYERHLLSLQSESPRSKDPLEVIVLLHAAVPGVQMVDGKVVFGVATTSDVLRFAHAQVHSGCSISALRLRVAPSTADASLELLLSLLRTAVDVLAPRTLLEACSLAGSSCRPDVALPTTLSSIPVSSIIPFPQQPLQAVSVPLASIERSIFLQQFRLLQQLPRRSSNEVVRSVAAAFGAEAFCLEILQWLCPEDVHRDLRQISMQFMRSSVPVCVPCSWP
mmetsp:Transcript_38384/g.90268  ORF Transcript_38384/g.90268 Transcript_38384/m.90268 type:complete len:406 (+) Transcript_38384:38-1255(+)